VKFKPPKFNVGDIIKSIPSNTVVNLDEPDIKIFGHHEGVIVGIKDTGRGEVVYEITYFDPEAADALYLYPYEMEKLNDS
jgi:hypothetical protein